MCNYSINDSGFMSDTSSLYKLSTQQENVGASLYPIPKSNVSSENIYKTPVKNVCSKQQQATNGSNIKYPNAWGSSPFTDHLRKTGRIQSIPPWFVCSDKRSSTDGKVLFNINCTLYCSVNTTHTHTHTHAHTHTLLMSRSLPCTLYLLFFC